MNRITDSEDVIRLICKRVVRRLNARLGDAMSCYGYPSSFSAFDIISIRWQDRTLDGIRPGLQDLVEGYLDLEVGKLSRKESALLDEDYECDEETGYSGRDRDIYDAFMKMLDEHYYLDKIQKYVWRCW